MAAAGVHVAAEAEGVAQVQPRFQDAAAQTDDVPALQLLPQSAQTEAGRQLVSQSSTQKRAELKPHDDVVRERDAALRARDAVRQAEQVPPTRFCEQLSFFTFLLAAWPIVGIWFTAPGISTMAVSINGFYVKQAARDAAADAAALAVPWSVSNDLARAEALARQQHAGAVRQLDQVRDVQHGPGKLSIAVWRP